MESQYLLTKAAEAVLEVKDLRVYYHRSGAFVRAVDGVSLRVARKARIGLAGESGSGKTQMALSILGLIAGKPGIVGGEIWIDGKNTLSDLDRQCVMKAIHGQLVVEKDVAGWQRMQERMLVNVRGRSVSMVFQEPWSALSPYFTVAQQLHQTTAARYGKNGKTVYASRVFSLLERLRFRDVPRILKAYPHELSGGESQRVMLALALIGEPQLLIADEPTTLLDASTQADVLDLLQSLLESLDLALLLISHDLAVLELLVEHIVVMFAGRVVEQGSTASVLGGDASARHPYTERLYQAASRDRSSRRRVPSRPVMPEKGAEMGAADHSTGCCFYRHCALREQLSKNEQLRCATESPQLMSFSVDHDIACWAIEGRA